MIIERPTASFRVFWEDPLLVALGKISDNRTGHLVVLSSDGRVEGMLTDGDVRRWLTRDAGFDLNVPVSEVCNTEFLALPAATPRAGIAARLDARVRLIPLIDARGHLVSIARAGHADLRIGARRIGADAPVFVIAEIGNNHNGDIGRAKRLVDAAIAAGADCAKFQMRDMASLYAGAGDPALAHRDLGAQYTLDLLSRHNLDQDALFEVFDYCQMQGIEPMCTPWDPVSLDALEGYGMRAYKVASADLTNHGLLRRIAETGKPLICSTGMASEAEIRDAVGVLRGAGAPFALLHCNSTYPAPYKDVNLSYLPRLAEVGGVPVGYSGHERGWFTPVAAVALGARIVEKHFTQDRGLEGNDHKVSLLPDEFAAMTAAIRATEAAMGSSAARSVTQGEMINREVLAKSLHAARDIPAGEVVRREDVVVRSPGQGVQPNRLEALIGRVTQRAIAADTPFFPCDLEDGATRARDYRFARPWGIPVRWHDAHAMAASSNPGLLEYHLSYKDMDERLNDWFDTALDLEFTVHAPELFSGDHILDLAADDPAVRARSIAELNRVCDLTRALRRWHERATRPLIVVNLGGFSRHGFLPADARPALYARIEASLAEVDTAGVEIIAQTMPPFPWHFGGQSHHNLFVDPDEIAGFCTRTGLRICLDVSHSQLACNHFDWSMREFVRIVGPHTAHLHLADAAGIDGEGLQIGAGDMDFGALARDLAAHCPGASFVPEVWQGHKNGGSGFWQALDRLEAWFSGDLV